MVYVFVTGDVKVTVPIIEEDSIKKSYGSYDLLQKIIGAEFIMVQFTLLLIS